MTPSRRTLWSWTGAMGLIVILIPAGGLGLAPLAGLFVMFAAPAKALWRTLRAPGLALIMGVLALGWFSLSYLWSPYERVDELAKLALLTPLFALVPLAALQLEPRHLPMARTWLVFAMAAVSAVMAAESLTRGDMTLSYKVAMEGYEGTRQYLQSAVDRALSRGATPALMMIGITAIMLWTTGRTLLRWVAGAMALICLAIAFDFNVHANGVAFIAALAVTAMAARWPRHALPLLLCAMAAAIMFTPLIFSALLALSGEEFRAMLPLSWEWRLEIWNYALSRIGEQPLTGHGLGAARVIATEAELRGIQIELLPMHAHNAGMTIWVETGLIGAALIALALLTAARAVMRMTLSRPAVMMVCWALTIWFVNVSLSYGFWQEWHHAAVAFAIAMTIIARPQTPAAGNLRHTP
ncbi:O-antigen ligase family protein [Glycocaulis sp.]